MNSKSASFELTQRPIALGRAALAFGLSAAMVLGTSPLVWAQNAASSSDASSAPAMRNVVFDQIQQILPHAWILAAILVGLLCLFIFRRTASRKGKTAAKRDRENHEVLVP